MVLQSPVSHTKAELDDAFVEPATSTWAWQEEGCQKRNPQRCRVTRIRADFSEITKDDEALKRQNGLEQLSSSRGRSKLACASETSLVSHFHFLPRHCLRTWQGTEEEQLPANTEAQTNMTGIPEPDFRTSYLRPRNTRLLRSDLAAFAICDDTA